MKLHKVFISILLILSLNSLVLAKEINLNQYIQQATNEHKILFVFLHKTNCGYCENMMDFTFNNDKIKAYIKKYFIYVSINIKEDDHIIYGLYDGNAHGFAKYIGYDFYPTSLFFDKDANLILEEVGYIDTQKIPNEKRFLKILKFLNNK
jgi:thioredoxin-related protein